MNKKSFYSISMFPYPSGHVHMGHFRNYVLQDIYNRYLMLNGREVLTFLGWDAFGLPAENAAIEKGIHPKDWTYKNISDMNQVIKQFGNYYTKPGVVTCDSSYYEKQQELFLKLKRAGFIYKKDGFVNWDPVAKTVLANEQVQNGKAWRSGATVERRKMNQWYFKTTKYAQELLNTIDALDWPDRIKNAQKEWIGRKEGFMVEFKTPDGKIIEIFTQNPNATIECILAHKETELNAQYLIAPEGEKIPVKESYEDGLFLQQNDVYKQYKAKPVITYGLKDWCLSRQRYWGCPIPIVYCENCGEVESIVQLPYDVKFGQGNPLENASFKNIKCPQCDGNAIRDTDTMDTFVDSAWYQLAYLCDEMNEPFNKYAVKPVDLYIGGAEHACLHLIYSRCFTKAFRDMNLLSFDEPFLKLVNQGMILAPAYTYEGNYVSLEDVVNKDDKYYCEMENGNFVPVQEVGIVKVSKSFKNTISPTKIIKQYGEAARLYIASNPIETDMEWSTEDINGCAKFLRKIENIKEVESKPASDAFKDLMNEATNNLNMLKFNCYVANIRSMMNMWTNSDIELGYLLVFLYPTCPVTTSNVYKNIFKREIEDRLWYTEDRLVKSHKKISVYMGNKFFFDMESVDEKTDLANALARLKNPSYNSFVYKFGNILKFI